MASPCAEHKEFGGLPEKADLKPAIPFQLEGPAKLIVVDKAVEQSVIGALLHDAAEDQGGQGTLDEIRRRFGDAVAEIVHDCTDAKEEPKPEWRPHKEA